MSWSLEFLGGEGSEGFGFVGVWRRCKKKGKKEYGKRVVVINDKKWLAERRHILQVKKISF